MARTLLDKVWDAHTVRTLPSGQTQLLIGLHLIHEVTTPQAFQMLKDAKLKVRMPERTFGTLDHIIPTTDQARPYADPMAEDMAAHMYRNMKDFGLNLFDMTTGKQGIVHVIGPELGLTQPGMTIACGDSHTATHGAVGAIAFGIGTTQVRDVLATQCLAMAKPKLRQVRVDGALARGVYAKDVILAIINQLGVKGGVGYAYEYAGEAIDRMTMEERLTLCNMSIEGGARFGYVNPDATTIDYLRGRPYAPQGEAFDRAAAWWKTVATEPGAAFDDVKRVDGHALEPVVTWGINPEMSVGVTQRIPAPESAPEAERPTYREALAHMGFEPGQPIKGARIDVAFVGSCTNGRLSDLRIAAEVARKGKVAEPRARADRAGLAAGRQGRRGRGAPRDLPAGRLPVAQGRLLDVPGHERRQAPGPGDERIVEQPQFHRPPGQPDRPHAPDEPGHGRGRRHHRRRRRREGDPEMTTTDFKRRQIKGRGIPVTGNDIDTDRIIPARFLKAVTFEGMGEHAFEDARKQNPEHPFNTPVYQGASVLVVGQNFGCGSSREHAPQALMRWGISAIVGGSFGEIFFGNCVMLGIPCLRASQEDLEWLQKAIGRSPQEPVAVDVDKQEVRFGDRVIKATVPDGPRNQLVNGTWDSTAVLLEAGAAIEGTARKLPYVVGF